MATATGTRRLSIMLAGLKSQIEVFQMFRNSVPKGKSPAKVQPR